MAEYNPDDLIDRTFLLPKNEQGERLRATIKRKVIETSKLLDNQHDNAIDKINFHLDVGQGRAEAIMSYVQILDHLDHQEQQEDLYKFRAITCHQGPLSPDPIESIYSGVVSIRSLRLVVFLAKLNNLEVWGADIGNAYLEAKTKEKLYIVAGPEFEELEGHILVIYKALYGLKSSGLRWSQKIHDIMLDTGFSPCKADPCV